MLDSPQASNTVDQLQTTVTDAVAQLERQGLLSGGNVGQLFSSVSDKLNGQTDISQKDERQKVHAYSAILASTHNLKE